MSDAAWDQPTPSPDDELKNLRYVYEQKLEELRLEYIDDIANRVADWFFFNYEDPVESTPRDDGEWAYIWGGPIDTYEIVEEELQVVPDDEREELIEATLLEIDTRGCGDVCVPLFGRYGPDDDDLLSAALPPDDSHDDFSTNVSV